MNLERVELLQARRIPRRLRRDLALRFRSFPTGRPAPGARLLDLGDRLVPAPVFVYCSVRSGSTLLRLILDSHSEVCAPHEMHLRSVRAGFGSWYAETAWKEFGIGDDDLRDLLWDRMLHLQLSRSGKSMIVDKTPGNVLEWKRIAHSWPEARYIFLKRHPLRMVQSLARSKPKIEISKHIESVKKFLDAWVKARARLPGPTVSYEQLTTEPEQTIRNLCAALGIGWEPAMLDYSAQHNGRFRRGLGDWTPKIKSGVIHEPKPLPAADEIPTELRAACAELGYL